MASPITTHVLDTSNGCAAQGVKVRLELLSKSAGAEGDFGDEGEWTVVGTGETNNDGRCLGLLPGKTSSEPHELKSGMYRLTFGTKEYYTKLGQPSFFPYAQVVFEVPNPPNKHYHVPIILSPYSYTTYRGT